MAMTYQELQRYLIDSKGSLRPDNVCKLIQDLQDRIEALELDMGANDNDYLK